MKNEDITADAQPPVNEPLDMASKPSNSKLDKVVLTAVDQEAVVSVLPAIPSLCH